MQKEKRNRDIHLIEDPEKRRNTKCKRIKVLLKKTYELSILCQLDLNIQIYDQAVNKLTEFSTNKKFSGKHASKITSGDPYLLSDKLLKYRRIIASNVFDVSDKLEFKRGYSLMESMEESGEVDDEESEPTIQHRQYQKSGVKRHMKNDY